MEVATKTDVNIIQELLAIYTARKEAIEKIAPQKSDSTLIEKLRNLKAQTDHFIHALMDELSLYGDAIAGEVNRNNSYLNTWKILSPQLSGLREADVQKGNYLSFTYPLTRQI